VTYPPIPAATRTRRGRLIGAALAVTALLSAAFVAPQSASAATPSGWKSFSSSAGGFAAAVPTTTYGAFHIISANTSFGSGLSAKVYSLETKGSAYAPIGMASFTFKKPLSSSNVAAVLQAIAESMTTQDGVKVLKTAAVRFGSQKWGAMQIKITDTYKGKSVPATMYVVGSPKLTRFWALEAPNAVLSTFLSHAQIRD
jgi:hypothetical protein